MLKELHIRDVAIIDDVSIHFDSGLTILSGETGAGKSVIIQSLKLALGEKADFDVIRSGFDMASVSVVFDLSTISDIVKSRLEELGVGVSDELIIKRQLNRNGRSRAFVNNEPATLQFLAQIAPYLIDISSQHDQQLLMNRDNYADIIDAFGHLQSERRAYLEQYHLYSESGTHLDLLKQKQKEGSERREFLEFQKKELLAANLSEGEDERLSDERSRIRHGAVIHDESRRAERLLSSQSGSAVDQLHLAVCALEKISEYDQKIGKWRERIKSAEIEVEDVARELNHYASSVDFEPARQEAIESRLHQLSMIKKKYGGSVEMAINRLETVAREVDLLENIDDTIMEAEKIYSLRKMELKTMADKLTGQRQKAAKKLSLLLEKELRDLGMPKAVVTILVQPKKGELFAENGQDEIEFYFSANPGEEKRPLAKIASGGELSRVLLAFKQVAGMGVDLTATYIFDEVDAGVGGAVAEMIGQKVEALSRHRQVLCITHLPQVAAYAVHHYYISKETTDGRTVTRFKKLSNEERVGELARMLGGLKITQTTRAHAEEMVKGKT